METTKYYSDEERLNFPDFDTIEVSTTTYTAQTNLVLDLDKISARLPLTEYTVVPKRRGRKKKTVVEDPNKDVPYGSIITVDYKGELRGTNIKCKCCKVEDEPTSRCSHCVKQQTKKNKKGFRNSFTVVIVLDKLINFKVYKNGTFQMTGCKSLDHAEMCVKTVWNFVKSDPEMHSFSFGTSLDVIFIPAMRNIDFSLGFKINRKRLHQYITRETNWHSFWEEDIGQQIYTGVNIQVPSNKKVTEMKLTNIVVPSKEDEWGEKTLVDYMTYVDRIEDTKDKRTKLGAKKDNTFLAFESGNLIMSGCCEEFMRDSYNDFISLIKDAYSEIKEQNKASESSDIANLVFSICNE